MYSLLVLVHVISAVGATGPLLAIFIMLKRLGNVSIKYEMGLIEGIKGAIRTVELSGHWLVPTGIVLLIFGPWQLLTSWVIVAVGVLVVSLLYLAKAFKPSMRLLDEPTFDKGVFINKMYKATMIYLVIMLILLWLMIAKPMFW